jgi:hypothetical protein
MLAAGNAYLPYRAPHVYNNPCSIVFVFVFVVITILLPYTDNAMRRRKETCWRPSKGARSPQRMCWLQVFWLDDKSRPSFDQKRKEKKREYHALPPWPVFAVHVYCHVYVPYCYGTLYSRYRTLGVSSHARRVVCLTRNTATCMEKTALFLLTKAFSCIHVGVCLPVGRWIGGGLDVRTRKRQQRRVL